MSKETNVKRSANVMRENYMIRVKNTLFLVVFTLVSVFLASCQSKEEKTVRLIKENLPEDVFDLESYEPMETTIEKAKMTLYNDTLSWNKASTIVSLFNDIEEYGRERKMAIESMYLYGFFSGSGSDDFQEYKEKVETYTEKIKDAVNEIKSLGLELIERFEQLNTKKVVGWEVNHRFKCHTVSGDLVIVDHRYVMDKGFKNILIFENPNYDRDLTVREVLGSVESGEIIKGLQELNLEDM